MGALGRNRTESVEMGKMGKKRVSIMRFGILGPEIDGEAENVVSGQLTGIKTRQEKRSDGQ